MPASYRYFNISISWRNWQYLYAPPYRIFPVVQLGQGCKCLKEIWLDNSEGIRNIGMTTISQYCSQLEKLTLICCPFISDISIVQITIQCKALKEITLHFMRAITDVGIVAISQHCRQLVKLSLEVCPAVSDISLQAIAENCWNLIYLELQRMDNLRNPSLIADIVRNNIRLKYDRITVSNCGKEFGAQLGDDDNLQ